MKPRLILYETARELRRSAVIRPGVERGPCQFNRRAFIKGAGALLVPLVGGLFLPSKAKATSSIVTETISAASDNVIFMSNSQFGRPVTLGAYTKLRIGIRGQVVNVGGSIGGTPRFALGLCHGTTNMVGDGTTANFCGSILNGSTWSWNGPGGGSVLYSDSLVPCTRVGSTLTTGTQFTGDFRYGGNASAGAYRMGYYLDITKGSPNFSLVAHGGLGTPGTAGDLSAANFLSSMTATSDASVLMNNGGSGGGASSAQTVAVDEGTNGTLDTVACWWNQSTTNLIISDIAVAVLS